MEFLGYIIFGDGIHMDPHKAQTIIDWAISTSICTRRNLEMNYYNFSCKIMDTCDYEPCSHLGQMTKDNQLQKLHVACTVIATITYHLRLQ
jgi:hypothetical protein